MGQASWGIVWVQLLGYALIAALLGFLATLISPSQTNNTSSASGLSSPVVIRALTLGSSLGLFILIPVLFFVVMGILFLLIRAFGGQGRFLQQSYTTLLFLVPFGVAVSVLGVIPFAGGFFSAFLGAIAFLYSIVLQIFATMAVH